MILQHVFTPHCTLKMGQSVFRSASSWRLVPLPQSSPALKSIRPSFLTQRYYDYYYDNRLMDVFVTLAFLLVALAGKMYAQTKLRMETR